MSEKLLGVATARADLAWVREHIARLNVDARMPLLAGESLAAALDRVLALQTSRIGNVPRSHDLDPVSFYAGVSYALAKVHQAIEAQP